MTSNRILVVEDEATIARYEKELLEGMGYRVTAVVDTGADALRSVAEDTPEIVLMDIMLRDGMDGIDLAEQIRREHDLPVVYVTAYADEHFIERAKRTEPFGYVVKPFDQQSLISNIEMALYKHSVEHRLRESEARYKDLFDNAPDMYFSVRQDGTVTSVNRFGAQYLGYAVEELVDGPVWRLVHPEDRERLQAHMASFFRSHQQEHVLEFRKVRKDGSVLWVHERIRPAPNEAGTPSQLYIICRDITERKQMEEQLRYLSTHDSVTGLYNRGILEKRLNEEINRAKRYQHVLSAFMVDIDRFKSVNDVHGHLVGDAVLRAFSEILHRALRKTDYAARYGGDEFVVILPETSVAEALEVAERLRCLVTQRHIAAGEVTTLDLTASIGIAAYPAHGASGRELLAAADLALYAAKRKGRDTVVVAGQPRRQETCAPADP